MATPTLDEMDDRARRYLDGMTVNKDAMARDVLLLTQAIRGAQKRAAEQTKKPPSSTPFAEIFGDVFSRFGR
ncbi:MAG: hypothetical protein Q8N17_17860 [Burkholderiaceae bacterium]|nr:hypothetical protein [Burkholderiaceae bacterium]